MAITNLAGGCPNDDVIGQVVYAVGFEDHTYFSRVFSEEYGVSPAKFRLSVQSEQ
ncbi:helix-turn-helix domain-containing protein [Spirosoma pulveris]